MDGLDAVGDAVTGGLLARAVEPAAGEAGADGHTHEKNCLNCGTKLSGVYCSACGQKAHVHRSVRAFFQDFVQGLFNFEGKIWRTLPMLAWRPGEMTRRYIAGEHYSVADITGMIAVDFMKPAKLAMPEGLNNLKRWHEDVSSRPSAKA